jgi:glutamate dehydrogenase
MDGADNISRCSGTAATISSRTTATMRCAWFRAPAGLVREQQADLSSSFAALAAHGARYARVKDILIVTKVHVALDRSSAGYLDYVGVKRYDANGESAASTASSACITSHRVQREPGRRFPLLRARLAERARTRAAGAGRPRAQAARATFSTRTRADELLQSRAKTPVRTATGHPAPRRAASASACSCSRDPVRALRLVPDLRAARDATRPTCARKWQAILMQASTPTSSEFNVA